MIRETLPATKRATFSILFPNKHMKGMPAPVGTGFFISKDGWFITAAHVITDDNEQSGEVRDDIDKAVLMKETRVTGGPSGEMCQSVSFGHILPSIDVALLKVDFNQNSNKHWLSGKTHFPHIEISTRELEEGESVYSFGYPLSNAEVMSQQGMLIGSTILRPRVTSAIISSSMEETRMVITNADPKVYVLDKALNYGNSGGPIVSVETGHVHALCSRFQPLRVPQVHLKDNDGNYPTITVPSLYGIVSRLDNNKLLTLLNDLKIIVSDS